MNRLHHALEFRSVGAVHFQRLPPVVVLAQLLHQAASVWHLLHERLGDVNGHDALDHDFGAANRASPILMETDAPTTHAGFVGTWGDAALAPGEVIVADGAFKNFFGILERSLKQEGLRQMLFQEPHALRSPSSHSERKDYPLRSHEQEEDWE